MSEISVNIIRMMSGQDVREVSAMPDGDIIHDRLTPRYREVYQQICEGQVGTDELAYQATHRLKGNLVHYGDAPLKLIQATMVELERVLSKSPLRSQVDWARESQKLNQIARGIRGNSRAIGLALRACIRVLVDLESGEVAQPTFEHGVHEYIKNVYKANFHERAPLTRSHYNNVAQDIVEERLNALQPLVYQNTASFAAQVARKGTVTRLRMPPKQKSSENLLHVSVFELGK